MATVSGALGQLGPEGAKEGRVSAPASPAQGPTQARMLCLHRDLGCRAWQVLEPLGRAGLSFGDFSFLAFFLVACPPLPSAVRRLQCP